MRLNKEIKERIDNFFDNISAEKLYDISINKYGFTEDSGFEISNGHFHNLNVELYTSQSDESYGSDDFNPGSLAA